jgi:hypothetical protein
LEPSAAVKGVCALPTSIFPLDALLMRVSMGLPALEARFLAAAAWAAGGM